MPDPSLMPSAHDVQEVVSGPTDHEELIRFLERDQLVADTSRPVATAPLSARVRAALWLLRAYVVLVSFMVIYTFVHQLG